MGQSRVLDQIRQELSPVLDCSYINSDRTTEIFEGTVAQRPRIEEHHRPVTAVSAGPKEKEVTVPEAIESPYRRME